MRSLRFCLVTTFYPPYHFGGDAVFVYRLAQALAERGHTVDVVHSIDAYRLREKSEPAVAFVHHTNVKTFALKSALPVVSTLATYELGHPAAYAAQLDTHFASHDYDVIHYHNVSLMGAPAVLRLGNAVKLYTAHEYWLVCPTHVLFKFDSEPCTHKECLQCTLRSGRPPQGWRYTDLLQRYLTELDMLFVPSNFSLQRHRDDGIDVAMSVLPHAVPVPAQLPEFPTRSARPYFLFAGRLERLKGVHDIIPAFASFADADLKIVGTGSAQPELMAQARGLAHVQFLGPLHPDSLQRLYQGATAVIVPSLCYETFALTAAESMAVGTPVIGRAIGAVRELVEASGGGITFSSLQQLREALSTMMNDTVRDEFGARGRAYALAQWTQDVHLARYFAVIEEKLTMRGSGAT